MMLRATSSAIALCLAGCFPTRMVLSRAPEPSARVEAVHARAFDRQHADLTLDLRMENPGPALAFRSADYEIFAQGRSFATGTVSISLSMLSGGGASLTLPIQLTYLDLPYAARNRLAGGGKVQVVVRGTLHGGAEQGTDPIPVAVDFAGEVELAATGEPER
ncbi:MAG: LEA type 2 family protein [Deltaproteobacteria bacterium]|nr:LEA type 2 family protein [Deltaproteobacteria bacterium]